MPNVLHPEMPADGESRRSLLSCLVDGELDAAAAAHGCGLWRDDAGSRADWHAYHLIGDALRSQDLALAPRRDAAFLARVRQRLEGEPAILAPQPAPRAGPVHVALHSRWAAPAAVAAGFIAVAGVVMVARQPPPSTATGPMLASGLSAPAASSALRLVDGASAALAVTGVVDAALIRDSRIDSYLRAHREMSGGQATAVPGGVLRSVDTIVPQR